MVSVTMLHYIPAGMLENFSGWAWCYAQYIKAAAIAITKAISTGNGHCPD